MRQAKAATLATLVGLVATLLVRSACGYSYYTGGVELLDPNDYAEFEALQGMTNFASGGTNTTFDPDLVCAWHGNTTSIESFSYDIHFVLQYNTVNYCFRQKVNPTEATFNIERLVFNLCEDTSAGTMGITLPVDFHNEAWAYVDRGEGNFVWSVDTPTITAECAGDYSTSNETFTIFSFNETVTSDEPYHVGVCFKYAFPTVLLAISSNETVSSSNGTIEMTCGPHSDLARSARGDVISVDVDDRGLIDEEVVWTKGGEHIEQQHVLGIRRRNDKSTYGWSNNAGGGAGYGSFGGSTNNLGS